METFMALLGGLFLLILVVFIAVYVIYAIGLMKIFHKMDEPGWMGLIPFLNGYILFKHIWDTNMYWIMLVISIVVLILRKYGGEYASVVNILNLVILAFSIYSNYLLSRSFRRGIGMTILLTIFPFIGTLVLGYGDSEYIGNTTKS